MSGRVADLRRGHAARPSSSACSPSRAAAAIAVAATRSASPASSRAATSCARSASRREPDARARPSRSRPSCARLERLAAGLRRDRGGRRARSRASTSSAAPCATSCSASRASTSTSRSRATRSRSRSALADALGGRARPHEKFGTAVVVYGDGERVDVVTARTEFYDAPAALPDGRARVDPRGPLPPRLHDQRDGRLAQGRGLRPARRPLRRARATSTRGAVRVLHNLSFIDDPTRIFRGDPLREPLRLPHGRAHGAARARRASRWVSSATSRRRGCATSSSRCSRRARSGTRSCGSPSSARDRAIHPHLAADDEAVELFERAARAARRATSSTFPTWRLGLAALARRCPPTRSTTGSSG